MGKKTKKKRVKDRLAKKRGMKRTKTKKKIPPPKSKKVDTELINKMMISTIPLADMEELRGIKFDNEKLTAYLEEAKNAPEINAIDFIREGIKRIITVEFLINIKSCFENIINERKADKNILIGIDSYFRLLAGGISPEYIPLFVFLFARQVKQHPLSDDARIWKYIMDYLPKKVIAPEKTEGIVQVKPIESEQTEEKRDEHYPHIVLPE